MRGGLRYRDDIFVTMTIKPAARHATHCGAYDERSAMMAKQTGWVAVLGAAFLLSASGIANAGPYVATPGDLVAGNIVNTIDENGHGTLNGFQGPQPEPFALQTDPGPGGLANALTYSLLNPPGLTAGDLLIH